MSKHSKWAKIKRQKGAADNRRAQVFTKLARAITVAAREGADPERNSHLRIAVDRAMDVNMPKDNIQRAIDRASGADTDIALDALVLEGFGPTASAFLVDAISDSRNRTLSEIRKIFQDAGGTLGASGSTQWLFARKGHISLTSNDLDTAELTAIDAGASQTEREDDGTLHVLTDPETVHAVAQQLRSHGFPPASLDLIVVPLSPAVIAADEYERATELLATLEDHDDVVNAAMNVVSSASS